MRFHELLLEYDRSKAMAAFGGKLQARIASDPKVESIEELFTKLEGADPTQNKQYVNWLVRAYQAGSKLEDLTSRGHDSLEKFELLKKHKQLPADKTDISKYPNLEKLEEELEKYQVKKPEPIQIDRGKYKILADTPTLRIIIPEDIIAAKFWGQGTRWCTAAKNNNMFAHYNKQGNLYIIIPKYPKYPGEKYQFHFKTNQFMDEKDEEIDLIKFIDEYPETKKYFADKHIAFNENPTEEEQLVSVKKSRFAIQYIKNPSEKVQLAAVSQYGHAIQYIKNPSEAVQLAAVNQDGSAIEYIKNPSEAVQLAAVSRDGWAVRYIKNPSEALQLAAVSQYGHAIQYIKNPSEKVRLAAVNQKTNALYFIIDPSEAVQLAAVKKDGRVISYINNPTEKVQLAAVSQYGHAIRFIDDPTDVVQLAAVNQDEYAIHDIKNPTPKVIALARSKGIKI